MQHFRKILVGVDLAHDDRLATAELAGPTQEAVRRAVWLASQTRAELTFLAVLDVSPQTEDALERQTRDGERTIRDAAADILDRLVDEARQEGATAAREEVVCGRPWTEIIRTVEREGHDLVIIGTRRHGGLSRLLFGGTGLKLMRHCPCPVWLTRPDPNWDDLNILVASDFSPTSAEALHLGVEAGRLGGAKLHVLHAIEPSLDQQLADAGLMTEDRQTRRRNLRDEAERQLRLQLAATDARTLPHGAMVHVGEGPPDLAILDAIHELGIDLLIVGTAARHGLAGALFGNTAERLLPHVPCSVLVVKPHGFESSVPLDESK